MNQERNQQQALPVTLVFSLISILLVPGHNGARCARVRRQCERLQITLIGNWRAESYTDAVGRQKTEFVFEKRDQGLLRVTRENLGGSSLKDVVRREVDNFTLCYSCVSTGQEIFASESLSGIRVSHYFVEGDRRMVGTFYFLQQEEAVWILRFSGRADSPGLTSGITDAMIRSFSPHNVLY
jgi:hypothetical protein